MLDPIADKVLISGAYLAFLSLGVNAVKAWMVAAIIGREVLVSALRSMAGRRGVIIHSSQLAKWKTGLQMGVALAILILMCVRASSNPSPGYWTDPGSDEARTSLFAALLLTITLTILSGLDYVWKNREVFPASAARGHAFLRGVLRIIATGCWTDSFRSRRARRRVFSHWRSMQRCRDLRPRLGGSGGGGSVAIVVVAIVSIPAANAAEVEFGHDGGPIVVDEVIRAMDRGRRASGPRLWSWVAGFLFLRPLDIFKPFPAGRTERLPPADGECLPTTSSPESTRQSRCVWSSPSSPENLTYRLAFESPRRGSVHSVFDSRGKFPQLDRGGKRCFAPLGKFLEPSGLLRLR